MRKLRAVFISLVLSSLTLGFPSQAVFADITVTVNGNGSTSTNNVTVEQNRTTDITSTNTATVNTTVAEKANTGGNEITGATGGENAIQTGTIATTTTVANNLNTSSIDAANCCQNSQTVITEDGNGAGSTNHIDNTNNSQTTVTVTNVAQVSNQIAIDANTGDNQIFATTAGDTSDPKIKTGNIKITGNVNNAGINTSTITVPNGSAEQSFVSLIENGVFSTNDIVLTNNQNVFVTKNSDATIDNDIVVDANTGDNVIALATGGITNIETGDIDINFGVTNVANQDVVIVSCCSSSPSPSGSPSPLPTPTPGENNNGGGGGSSSSGGGGDSSGGGGSSSGGGSPDVIGEAILPNTGIESPFRLLVTLGLASLFAGICLKLSARYYNDAFVFEQI